MLSIVLWIVWVVATEGLRIGSAGQGSSVSPTNKPRLLLQPPRLASVDEADEDEESARGLTKTKSDILSLFKKQVKCTDVGLIPLANECGKYLDCTKSGGSEKTLYCSTGKLFDHLRRECVPGSEARCRGLCRHEGDDYADPKNRSAFLRCRSGVPMPKMCPDGMEFKATSGQCDDASKEADEYSEDDY